MRVVERYALPKHLSGVNEDKPGLAATLAQSQTAPPKIGEKAVVTIADMAFGGEGVGRIGDFVVFVPFVAPGEEVEIELTEVKKRYGRGQLLRILKQSPERVAPLCPYFGDCGGCQYQHLAYSLQLEIKRKQIADLFERIGGLTATTERPEMSQSGWGSIVAPVIPCPSPYGYRNRIMIRSQWDKFKQGLNIGFIRADNRLVVDIKECKIAEPALNAEIAKVRQNPPPKGGLKVVLRIPPEGWEVPRDSFFQNNFFLVPELVRVVRSCLEQSKMRSLVDAYCGVGFFAIQAADLVEGFVGIELDVPAIKAARINAASHGAANGEFLCGSTEELLPSVLAKIDPGQTAVILDPPRTGCRSPCG